MTHILVAEDEERISSFVVKGLHSAGYSVTAVASGTNALERLRNDRFDLVLLDIGMPGVNGLEVLRRIRLEDSQLPVIMLTARTSLHDTVTGLDIGASDYIPKPFRVEELLARIRSRLRAAEQLAPSTVSYGDIEIDLHSRRATVKGRNVELSAREFSLVHEFLRNADRVLSREHLLSTVWGVDFDPGSNVVDVYVRYLRAKVGASRIETVRGAGYRLVK